MNNETYETPTLTTVGTIHELTQQFDKIGSAADIFTALIPDLDGDIEVD